MLAPDLPMRAALAVVGAAAQMRSAWACGSRAGAGHRVHALVECGLAVACLPEAEGGVGLATDPRLVLVLVQALRATSRLDLSAGRILEGHVNAVRLVAMHGTAPQLARVGAIVRRGGMLGIWAADAPGQRATLTHGTLAGIKAFCSGAGALQAAIVVCTHQGGRQMVLVEALDEARIDRAAWHPTGMEASESFSVCLDGMVVAPPDLVGGVNDYVAEPAFSAGHWRILALQLGGIEAIAGGLRRHLRDSGRGDGAAQRLRLADALIAAETARLWVQQAALLAEAEDADAPLAVAHVGLARLAVRRAAEQVIALAQQGVGLAAMLAPHPLEHQARDLATLLRQPDPDGALERASTTLLHCPAEVGEAWM
jgi:alkylation response protein AidB-like acyl-CoA dehydrogenase